MKEFKNENKSKPDTSLVLFAKWLSKIEKDAILEITKSDTCIVFRYKTTPKYKKCKLCGAEEIRHFNHDFTS